MTLKPADFELQDEDIPPAPQGDPFGWAEYALGRDLEIPSCPICTREVPDGFFLWRPAGLKYWRCLACLARTYHSGMLHVTAQLGLP